MQVVQAGWAPAGDYYTYTAVDHNYWTFQYWTGNIDTTDRTVSGTLPSTGFTEIAVFARSQCTLSVDWDSSMGDVSVSPNPGTMDCLSGVSGSASAYPGYVFTGWSGDYTSDSSSITFLLDRNMSITANFDVDPSDSCDPLTDDLCVCDEFGCTENLDDPLVFELSDGPWRLTGVSNPVRFDIRATGTKQTTAWTAAGADIAFLALDRNGNGRIDDGSELFGNGTRLANGQRASNGFEALAQYDANGDGVIDARDPIWNSLLLWIDRNHDGISQPDELIPISSSPITAIELKHHWAGRHDSSGNLFRYEGRVHLGNVVRSFYDVYFVIAR